MEIRFIIYIFFIYTTTIYIYGLVTHFSSKNSCLSLMFSGSPGQTCVSYLNDTARCWNTGDNMSCSHCIFGHEKNPTGGHVCKSNVDSTLNTCRYSTTTDMPNVSITPSSLSSAVKITYKSTTGMYEEYDTDSNTNILNMLIDNCFFDIEVETNIALNLQCDNVTSNGNGFCIKDYDTAIKGKQTIRYRPDDNLPPGLTFTEV